MCEPEAVGTIVQRIMQEMQETITKAGGDQTPIDLWDEPPRPAPLPKPRLRLLQGGKEGWVRGGLRPSGSKPCGD